MILSTNAVSQECQQASSKTLPSYASIPNDIWSLGVILVNLTCGRNPWRRACTEDATYLAFLSDSNFLSSILPISSELNAILARIFVPVPERRLSIKELRSLILRCPRFTVRPGLPMPSLESRSSLATLQCLGASYPSPILPFTPPQSPPLDPVYPPSPASLSSSGSSMYGDSACSTPPSLSLVPDHFSPVRTLKTTSNPKFPFCGFSHPVPQLLLPKPLLLLSPQPSIKAY